MPVWTMPAVAQQPTVHLCRWRVYRFTLDGQHWDVLSGWDPDNNCGRCSTPIAVLDAGGLRAQTRSGRVYNLAGAPGFDADALYVFQARFGTEVPRGWQRTEVTDEYWRQMQAGVLDRLRETASELLAELLDTGVHEDRLVAWLCTATEETGTTPVELILSGRGSAVAKLLRSLSAGSLG